MVATLRQADRIVLHSISWEQFERLLPIRELPQLIEAHRAAGRRAIRRVVREWARSQVSERS